jgi:hypothetical protein
MKPVQVVLLVVAGALGGAVITNQISHKAQPPKHIAVAQAQPAPTPPSSIPVAPPAPAPVQAAPLPEPMPEAQKAAEEKKPSPVAPVQRHEPAHEVLLKPHTVKAVRSAPPPANPRPIETARVNPPQPVPQMTPAPVTVAPPAPELVQTPPARSEPEHATPAPPPEPAPNRVTLSTGMLLPVRLIDGLSSERNIAGDTFTGTLDKELVVDGFVIAERGARVEGRVASVERPGKTRGVAQMALELTRIHTSDGQSVSVHTDPFDRRAEASHQEDAAKIGGGAAVGAIIGAIAGGGKGAAIGAGVGGGAGAGDVLLTRGRPVTFPTETRISFRLRAPVTVTERR